MRKINEMAIKADVAVRTGLGRAKRKVADILGNKRGDGYVDSAIKIIIAVVIGGLLLAGIYALFNTVVIPKMTEKVTNMFTYNG